MARPASPSSASPDWWAALAECRSKAIETPCPHTDSTQAAIAASRAESERLAGIPERYAGAECELGTELARAAWLGEGAYLYGPPGTGKTHALMAAARVLLAHGRKCRVWGFSELLARQKAEWGSKDAYDWVADANRRPVLVLDELGEGKLSDWAVEQLYRVVDGRYKSGRPLLCASNYSLDGLCDRLSAAGSDSESAGRLCSRLAEMCRPRLVDGPDRRMAAALARKRAS